MTSRYVNTGAAVYDFRPATSLQEFVNSSGSTLGKCFDNRQQIQRIVGHWAGNPLVLLSVMLSTSVTTKPGDRSIR